MQTARLLLRQWKTADRDPFAELNADAEVMRHFPSTLSRDESNALMDRFRSEIDSRGFGFWAVELTHDASFIGFVGLWPCPEELPFAPAVEIGWRIARRFQRMGYATEAARASLEFGFSELGLEEIVAYTATENGPSQRLMRKLGMERNPEDDFNHPRLPPGHPLRPHVVYRIQRG